MILFLLLKMLDAGNMLQSVRIGTELWMKGV